MLLLYSLYFHQKDQSEKIRFVFFPEEKKSKILEMLGGQNVCRSLVQLPWKIVVRARPGQSWLCLAQSQNPSSGMDNPALFS